jgi:hypothetical protein
MRTWMKFAPAVLLLLPLAPTAAGADPETNTAQKIEKLQTDVAALRQDVAKLQNDMIATNLKAGNIDRKLDDILQRLDRMASASSSTRYYGPPPEGVPGVMAPTTATITVRNQYSANATIHINGRPYLAPAGQDVRIGNVPLGPINYDVEVDGYGLVQPLRTETLRPNGRIITIFPQFGG